MIANIEIKSVESLLAKRSQVMGYLNSIGLPDSVIYNYVKQGSLFSKKEEKFIFSFIQGLNTNPQNLSIFLRDEIQRESKVLKQKLVKGIFVVYDIFTKSDCVIEISIPGNLRIYKIQNNKKELISNEEIDLMYVSAVIRAMCSINNMMWGKSYSLFRSGKNALQEYKSFLNIFVKVASKKDIYISDDFENNSVIKGSHLCSVVFEYAKDKRIVHQTIELLEQHLGDSFKTNKKIWILLAELYCEEGKFNKSLLMMVQLMKHYGKDPFLMYYRARYMFKLLAIRQALTIVHGIIHYHQYQIWMLAAHLHYELKNYNESLVCLNHASKMVGKQKNSTKNLQLSFKEFESLGKPKYTTSTSHSIQFFPKILAASETPLSIATLAEEKNRPYLEKEYWKMNSGQKSIYDLMKNIRYRLDIKKFQQLLQTTFEEAKLEYPTVSFKQGMIESVVNEPKKKEQSQMTGFKKEKHQKNQEEELPNFLQDESMEVEAEQIIGGNRNLSIIPEIESVIENSQYEETEKEHHFGKQIRHKKQMTQMMYKLLRNILAQTQMDKAEFEDNYAKLLPVFNKLRTLSRNNNYFTSKMFDILVKTGNFKSIIVLIAETLDFLEQKGIRKIDMLPFWIEKYVFLIIEEKGLKYLNDLLGKLDFFDEAILDCIELAKQWKIKGCTF